MLRLASTLLAGAILAGCQGQTSTEPPIVPIRSMHEQPRYDAQERSQYFADGRTMRPPVPHTVAREMIVDPAIADGLTEDGRYVASIPDEVVTRSGGMAALLERGRGRYEIYCVPCHGGLGDGQGMVPRVSGVAAITPPTFHEDRLRHMPDGQLFATISNGVRNMPAYGAQVPVMDRWAIVAYVRALQLAQLDQPAARTETDR
ncbi:MAG TPA: cytochrome c [Sandaracinaceae bacterium]